MAIANGALTARGARSYGYDSADRLVSVNAAGGAALSYDPAGRLGGLVVGGLETRFVYDGGQLTAEANASGTILRRYVPGPGVDETLALIDANGVSYAMNDQRNTPSAWADAAGNPNVQLYGAFGEEGPANSGRIGFTGQMRLPELGLAYYKARFYDPQIGRFLTPDPAGYTDGPNLYAYVLNDPINFTDPSGLCETRTGSRICITADNTSNSDLREPVGGAGGGGGCAGGGIADDGSDGFVLTGCRIARGIPYRPPVLISGPIFGRGPPGRMDLPPDSGAIEDVSLEVALLLLPEAKVLELGLTKLLKLLGCGCFVAGTLVATPDGLVPIEAIEIGDLVLAYDEATGKNEAKPVIGLIRPEPKTTFLLAMTDAQGEREEFEATTDHPWLVLTSDGVKRWVETLALAPGDRLLAGDGETQACRKFRVSAGMVREGVSHAQTQSPLDPGRDFGPVVGRRGRQDSL